jgi:hypothetical protein
LIRAGTGFKEFERGGEAQVKVGDVVIYTDEVRNDHNAIVTAIWGQDCINVVFLSPDESKTDPYGRQIERQTSVARHTETNNYGRSFRDVGVEATFVHHPVAK